MATYGYANVCKNLTNSVMETISEQEKILIKIGNRNSKIKRPSDIYIDTGEGNNLKELLDKVRAGDTIVVSELGYLCHSAKDFAYIVGVCAKKGVRLLIGGWDGRKAEEIDCRPNKGANTDVVQGMVFMTNLFSRIESEKIKRGMIKASADGKTVGRPKITAQTLPTRFTENYPKYKKGELTKSDFARVVEVSRPTLYVYLEIAEKADM